MVEIAYIGISLCLPLRTITSADGKSSSYSLNRVELIGALTFAISMSHSQKHHHLHHGE